MTKIRHPLPALPRSHEDRDMRDAQLAVLALCIAHVVLWTLVPALTYPSVPQDTVEGIAWGNLWQLGYDKHPFLAPWLSALVTDVFGTVGWPVYLASQLCIALTFSAVWSLAREILVSPWRAFAAVALLEGTAFFNTSGSYLGSSFILNPNVVMLPTWAMLSVTAYRALQRPDALRWAHAGLWAGLAILAKLESGLLLLALAAIFVATPEGRRSLRSPGVLAGAGVALLVASPHLIWLTQHDFLPVQYALHRLDTGALPGEPRHGAVHPFYQPLLFLRSQFAYVAATPLLFLALKRQIRPFNRRSVDDVFVLALTLGPLLIALLFAFATHGYLVTSWGFPFYSMAGIALVHFWAPAVSRRRATALAAAVGALTAALVIHHQWKFHDEPWDQAVFPYKPLTELVTQEWNSEYQAPLRIVAGDRWTVAGMIAYSPRGLVPYFGWDSKRNPWLHDDQVQKEGAVFIHRLKDEDYDTALIRDLKARYPTLSHEETVALPPLSTASLAPIRFWIAYLPPQG